MANINGSQHRSKCSKQLILEYFLANVGKVLQAREIQRASGGGSELARSVSVLCNEDGYQIVTHEDRAELKPDQYLMLSTKRRPEFIHGISRETHHRVFERDRSTCQMCGYMPGDPDPLGDNQTVRLTIRYFIAESQGGDDSEDNLRAVCTNCNEGLQNTALPKPNRIHLLAQIRRATMDDQRAVLDWLLKKFKLDGKDR